jgi:hypothetical protein
MPSREVVRSLSLPKNGFPTIANRAPIPVTTAKLLGARSIPTSESTFNAKVTSRGARNSRLVLMNANVYRVMNPHPTRRAAPSSPAVEGRCRWALGELGPEPETSGVALSQGGVEPAAWPALQ